MAYKIFWDTRAYRDLKNLDVQAAVSILNAINKLHEYPEQAGKPLKGKLKNGFRLRVGDYRILFTIDKKEQIVAIFAVGHRKDIYDVNR